MTCILSWNIQNAKGIDGKVSLERISAVIASMGRPEVICLQEVSRGLSLSAEAGAPDQIAELSDLFPAYETVFGVAVDALCPNTNQRWQFGNAVLTRLPLLSFASHILPRPGVVGKRHMTRQATEVVVADREGPLRIVNLHLELHSTLQRLAQVDRLRELHREVLEEQELPPLTDAAGPYQAVARPSDGVLCGDFNMLSGSKEYQRLLAPLAGEAKPFHDAWQIAHPGVTHAPTCGLYDGMQWPEGPHCRDFFFVYGNCVSGVSSVRVDANTHASDHQPLLLDLVDRQN